MLSAQNETTEWLLEALSRYSISKVAGVGSHESVAQAGTKDLTIHTKKSVYICKYVFVIHLSRSA